MAYELKYVKRVEYLAFPYLYLGGSLHLALRKAFEEKLQGNELRPDEVAGLFADFWDGEAYLEDEETVAEVDWRREDPGELREAGILLAQRYWRDISPRVTPVDVEVPFEREVAGVVLTGRIDLVTVEGKLVDWKTTRRATSDRELARHLQPSLYLLGMGAEGGEFEFHELVKTNNPYCRIARTRRSAEELSWLQNVLLPRVVRQIESGLFPPNPTSFLCSPDTCEVWSYCRRR